jgi:dihydrofolate reductase
MRKVILSCAISLDGYLARPNGAVDFLRTSEGAGDEMTAFFGSIDTAFFGRKTFEAGEAAGLAPPKTPWTTYVFSRTLPPGEGKYGYIFVNESPESFIHELRKRPGKNIFHMGGGELVRAFLEADLVDELGLGLVPVLLGEGIPLFPGGFPQRDFSLLESKSYPNGVVSLRYQRDRVA